MFLNIKLENQQFIRVQFHIVNYSIRITSNQIEKYNCINDQLTHEAIIGHTAMNRIPIYNKIARVSHIMARLINFLEEQ